MSLKNAPQRPRRLGHWCPVISKTEEWGLPHRSNEQKKDSHNPILSFEEIM